MILRSHFKVPGRRAFCDTDARCLFLQFCVLSFFIVTVQSSQLTLSNFDIRILF